MLRISFDVYKQLLASEQSKRDTIKGNTIENREYSFVCLYICVDVHMSFVL